MKPNWRLIAILGGAVATVLLVVVMFIASSQGTGNTGLPTAEALASVPDTAVEKSATVTIDANNCVFVDVDSESYFAIWPAGFSQDVQHDVVATDGSTYSEGQTIRASTVVTDRAAALELSGGGDDDYLGLLMAKCMGDSTRVAIITAVTG